MEEVRFLNPIKTRFEKNKLKLNRNGKNPEFVKYKWKKYLVSKPAYI